MTYPFIHSMYIWKMLRFPMLLTSLLRTRKDFKSKVHHQYFIPKEFSHLHSNNKATCFLSYFLVYPVKICLCFSRKLLENLSAVSLSVKNLLNAQTREKVLRLFRSTHILWCSTSLYASALSHFSLCNVCVKKKCLPGR